MRRRSVQDEPLLSIDDITIRVWERLVFAGTSWCIGSDQRWAVVGPTGSGKSTLVKALWGGVPVVRGDIRYGFAPDGDARLPEDRIVHVSFDDRRELVGGADAYYQARWDSVGDQDAPTVADVLAEAADEAMPDRSAGTGRARHCRRAADRLGMAGLLDRKITHLSNGEQSKLLIARALARCPVLLILDDPFAGLDNRTRSRLRGALGTLMTQGELIVLVTSRVDDLPEAVTHVLCVERNRVLAQGTRRSVLGRRDVRACLGLRRVRPRRLPVPTRRTRATRSTGAAVPIELNRVSVSYGDVDILTNVSWTVRRGEHWAVLGPNGAGKTTLLSLLSGDNPQAYANDVRVFGRRRGSGESIWDIKQRIGWLAPEMQVHTDPGLRCADVVCSGWFDSVGLYRVCSARQRGVAKRWLSVFGLEARHDTPFGHLSSGEQRMVLLARALVKGPELAILDEPCQGLDAGHRARILATIDRVVSETGTGLIYVTHRFNEMPGCVSHVLRLRRGRVVRKGTIQHVLGR